MSPTLGTIIVLLIIAALVALCIRSIVKDHKAASDSPCGKSCGGSCSSCSFYDPNTPITIKRPKKAN